MFLELCATYDVITGKSDCGEAGSCMGLSDSSKCGCGYAQGNKLPRCTGHCIVQAVVKSNVVSSKI